MLSYLWDLLILTVILGGLEFAKYFYNVQIVLQQKKLMRTFNQTVCIHGTWLLMKTTFSGHTFVFPGPDFLSISCNKLLESYSFLYVYLRTSSYLVLKCFPSYALDETYVTGQNLCNKATI